MMQPAESLVRKNATRSCGRNPAVRCSLPESEVGAIVVVVADIFGDQPSQMTFIQGNDVIQQIVAATTDPTLRHAVLPRTFEGSPYGTDLQSTNRDRDVQPIFPISVKDQKSGSRPKWKCFSQLLNDPQPGRVPGDVDVQDSSTVVTYDEETVKHTEAHGWNREDPSRRWLPDDFEGRPVNVWLARDSSELVSSNGRSSSRKDQTPA